ncbi:MAG: 16S rRNA (adenine(1518)-N(6)/adenine(1519)-N(6))-dimethyltransferase RsmA [Patescibacteria group bacterium]|nr:16S rRNA (adenine(1518)-N(6)/adenine(1519)-N(6))-dimethyltransferase RsmA [Patescibacteria group bacterium]
MSPTEIKAVLASLGARPNKGLGQNFLIDQKTLEIIVETAAIKPGDLVLEVGPGLGVLTRELLDKGAEVVAIERDRRFAEYLAGSEVLRPKSSVRIVQGDAADVHWHELIGEGNWKFVSNLPYSITSFALRKALWAPKPPENLVVLVQREVGERATEVADSKNKKKKTSLLSLMVALSAESSRIVRRVSAGCFFPPPKVESVILQVTPMPWAEREKKWGINPEKIMETAKRGFAHPRKLLKSNLAQAGVDVESYLCELGINEKARAEDLSPEDWARLTRELFS